MNHIAISANYSNTQKKKEIPIYVYVGEIFLYEFSMSGKVMHYFVSKVHPLVVVSGDITLEKSRPINCDNIGGCCSVNPKKKW